MTRFVCTLDQFLLIHIAVDPDETTDRSSTEPEVLARMKEIFVDLDAKILAVGTNFWKTEKEYRANGRWPE